MTQHQSSKFHLPFYFPFGSSKFAAIGSPLFRALLFPSKQRTASGTPWQSNHLLVPHCVKYFEFKLGHTAFVLKQIHCYISDILFKLSELFFRYWYIGSVFVVPLDLVFFYLIYACHKYVLCCQFLVVQSWSENQNVLSLHWPFSAVQYMTLEHAAISSCRTICCFSLPFNAAGPWPTVVTFHGKTYTNGFPLNGQNERLPNGSQTGHQAV